MVLIVWLACEEHEERRRADQAAPGDRQGHRARVASALDDVTHPFAALVATVRGAVRPSHAPDNAAVRRALPTGPRRSETGYARATRETTPRFD